MRWENCSAAADFLDSSLAATSSLEAGRDETEPERLLRALGAEAEAEAAEVLAVGAGTCCATAPAEAVIWKTEMIAACSC